MIEDVNYRYLITVNRLDVARWKENELNTAQRFLEIVARDIFKLIMTQKKQVLAARKIGNHHPPFQVIQRSTSDGMLD